MIFPQRRIPWNNHYRFWLFKYEIIRHTNLISNRLLYVRDEEGASATVTVIDCNCKCVEFLTQLVISSSASFAQRGRGYDFRSGQKSSTAELYWQICGYLVTILKLTNLYEITNAGWYTKAYCNSSTGLDCYMISPPYIVVFLSILPDEVPFWIYTGKFHLPSRRKEVYTVLVYLCSYNDIVNGSVYVNVPFLLGDFPVSDPPRLHLCLTPKTTYGRLSRMLAKHNIESVSLPPRKIFIYLPPVKDALGIRTPGVYRIPRECGQVYKASPKRYRTFAIARQWAGAGRLRRRCCVA